MKLFLISPKAICEKEVERNIEQKFPGHYIVLDERNSPAWIVAAPNPSTSASISDELGIGAGNGKGVSDALGGLVVQIHDYCGFDTKSLWQQLEVWRNERG